MVDQDLAALWDAHSRCEFETHDMDATMVDESCVNHVPIMTSGVGRGQLKSFYRHHFVDGNREDKRLVPISRTVGADSLVDEMLFCFTQTREIDWVLPGIAPTGRIVGVPLVAVVKFDGGKLVHEHIYRDQASVLVQTGLLDPAGLPVTGAEGVRKAVDKTPPSNTLMPNWASSAGKPL